MSEEDFLDVDQPIRGQNYVCLSFVSPEKILRQKDLYYVKNFLQDYFKNKQESLSNYKKMNDSIQHFYKLANKKFSEDSEFSEILNDLNKYSKISQASYDSVKNMYNINYDKIKNYYDDFVFANEDRIEKEFTEQNDFRTTMRGLKVRGVYDTLKEAQIRAKVLQRKDKNFNVFVGQVGYWLPWDPSTDKIEDQEYSENQLNTIVKKYKENQRQRDEHFEQRRIDELEKNQREIAKKKKRLEQLKAKQAKKIKEQETIKQSIVLPSSEEAVANIEELRTIVDQKNSVVESLTQDDPWMQRKLREQQGNEETKNNTSFNSDDAQVVSEDNVQLVDSDTVVETGVVASNEVDSDTVVETGVVASNEVDSDTVVEIGVIEDTEIDSDTVVETVFVAGTGGTFNTTENNEEQVENSMVNNEEIIKELENISENIF